MVRKVISVVSAMHYFQAQLSHRSASDNNSYSDCIAVIITIDNVDDDNKINTS